MFSLTSLRFQSGEDVISVPDDIVLQIIGDTPRYPKSLEGMVSDNAWKEVPWFAKLALLSASLSMLNHSHLCMLCTIFFMYIFIHLFNSVGNSWISKEAQEQGHHQV